MEKKTICVDFDGVIAQYDGFKGNDIFGDPIDGVQSAMEVLKKKGFTIIIFTTRTASSKLKKYLNDNHITYDYINENPDQPKGSNSGKPIADIYLDDRAICFKGNLSEMVVVRCWPSTMEKRALPFSSLFSGA